MATDIKGIIEGAARAAGTVVGTAAGMAAGAAQALVGKTPQPNEDSRKAVDPLAEELYWREHYASEPYFDGANFGFEDYLPAWQTGWEGRMKYAGRTFEDAARELEKDFHWNRGSSRLLWEQAREAVRAAFQRSL